nr:TIGR04076 family protein [Candidatus Njordarchaeota archaeon]
MIPIADYGFTVEATVKEIRGKCSLGYKVGDRIVFDGIHIRGKVCPSALATIVPTIYAFMWGAEFPWNEDRDVTTVPCVDEKNQVVFELKRDRNHPWFRDTESLNTSAKKVSASL